MTEPTHNTIIILPFHLPPLPTTHTEPLLNATSPLSLLTTELHYESLSTSASVAVELRDNDIALEVPEVVSLGIILSSSQCYDLTITATEITVLDNDGKLL